MGLNFSPDRKKFRAFTEKVTKKLGSRKGMIFLLVEKLLVPEKQLPFMELPGH